MLSKDVYSSQLPQPFKGQIGNDECWVYNARDVHSYLSVTRDFATWIKSKIDRYGFSKDLDYSSFHQIVERTSRGATNLTEYHVTSDMAKELCMLQNNERGRQARRYFIQKEKELGAIKHAARAAGFANPLEFVEHVSGEQLTLWPLEDRKRLLAQNLLVDVALQAKAGSKVAQLVRLVKPLLMGGKGGGAL